MKKSNNLYNYSIPKSGNEETSYFLTKGRITFFPFFLRLLLCGVIYTVSFFITAHYTEIYIYEEIGGGKVTDETIITLFRVTQVLHLYILPVLLLGFVSIQGAKRMHDINKSGWYILIPVYNIYLTFLNGTAGSNDYGIDPKPMPKVTYFDELDENLTDLKNKQGIENKNNKDYSFLLFLGIIIVIVALIYISSYKTQKAYNPISAEPTAKNEMHERSNTFNKKSNVTSETETINSKQSEKKKENNENSDLNLEIDRYYRVLASADNPVFFYSTPNINDSRETFFNTPEVIHATYKEKYFVYVEFTNSRGQISKGWLKLSDLELM